MGKALWDILLNLSSSEKEIYEFWNKKYRRIIADNDPLESAKIEISKKEVGFIVKASNIVKKDPENPEMNTFFKSSSPLKKLTIISENTVKNISININLTNHFSSEGRIDWKTKSYMRPSIIIKVKKTKIIWKTHNLKIDEISSFFCAFDFEARDALLIITLSEPSFKMLPKKIWKFLMTPNKAIPTGPE